MVCSRSRLGLYHSIYIGMKGLKNVIFEILTIPFKMLEKVDGKLKYIAIHNKKTSLIISTPALWIYAL